MRQHPLSIFTYALSDGLRWGSPGQKLMLLGVGKGLGKDRACEKDQAHTHTHILPSWEREGTFWCDTGGGNAGSGEEWKGEGGSFRGYQAHKNTEWQVQALSLPPTHCRAVGRMWLKKPSTSCGDYFSTAALPQVFSFEALGDLSLPHGRTACSRQQSF